MIAKRSFSVPDEKGGYIDFIKGKSYDVSKIPESQAQEAIKFFEKEPVAPVEEETVPENKEEVKPKKRK